MTSQKGLLEHSWTPVTLGANNHYAMSTQTGAGAAVNSDWYSKYITMGESGGRRSLLTQRDMMDRDSIEVSRALDIMAEDLSSCNADNEDLFYLQYADNTKVLKTHIKTLSFMLSKWSDRTKLPETFYDDCRETFKYGSKFYIKKPDGSLKPLRHEQVVGYILSDSDDSVVTHYLIDWEAAYLNLKENFRRGELIQKNRQQRDNYTPISVEDMVVLKRGDTPFGESVLDRVYPIWRKMRLLEDAVVIYRVVRAPERRVFYIDVGRLPEKKHKEVIDRYRLQMKQKKVMNQNGQSTEISTQFDPHTTTEDFYLPTTSQGRSSRIETLQGGGQMGELSDLTYFARKMAAGLRVPPSMTDTHNENNDRDTYSDMRVGQVFQVEMRYMGFINRDKKRLASELKAHFEWFCEIREVDVPDEMKFRINEPHNFALYKEIEVNQSLLNVFMSTNQIENMSPRFAMRKYLNLSAEEMADNELLVLAEKGLTPDQIKEMPDEVIANVVYGDGRLGKEFGLPVQDQPRF